MRMSFISQNRYIRMSFISQNRCIRMSFISQNRCIRISFIWFKRFEQSKIVKKKTNLRIIEMKTLQLWKTKMKKNNTIMKNFDWCNIVITKNEKTKKQYNYENFWLIHKCYRQFSSTFYYIRILIQFLIVIIFRNFDYRWQFRR